MSAVADVIDLVLCIGRKSERDKLDTSTKHNGMMLAAYVVFFMTSVACVHTFTSGQFSVVLTLGSGVQCLGFFLLSLKVKYQKTVAGLSSKTLEMYVLFFFFRLGSTLFKEGYLPVDRTGDHVYQIADIGSLLVVLSLIFDIHKTYKDTYQAEHDTLPIFNAIPACLLLSRLLHANMNGNNFFDWVWMMSTLLDSIALLPQLAMLSKLGGCVESMTSHYVAALSMSRVMSFVFWLYGYKSAAPKDEERFNVGGYTIIVAHGFSVLLCADFMFYYLKGMWARSKCGGTSQMTGTMLPTTTHV